MYDMDVGCILKGSTASVIWYWDSFHIDIIYDFSYPKSAILKVIASFTCKKNSFNIEKADKLVLITNYILFC
jgi:hypothetical protein